MEIVAIILAGASFVISVAALYATALKKAQIGIHYTPLDGEWHVGGWNGLVPAYDSHLTVALYAHNSGANAGIMEKLEAASSATLGGLFSDPVTWYPVKTAPDLHPTNARAQFPQAIDAGEIEELYFVGRMHLSLGPIHRLSPDEQADIDREETFARQLHEAKMLPITVTWRYARPAGFFSRGAAPETKPEHLHLELPVDGLCAHVTQAWTNMGGAQGFQGRARRLVAIATTGKPPDS